MRIIMGEDGTDEGKCKFRTLRLLSLLTLQITIQDSVVWSNCPVIVVISAKSCANLA